MPIVNCETGRPFIELGEADAPVLDYNIPQKNCLDVVWRIPFAIDRAKFKRDYEDNVSQVFEGIEKAGASELMLLMLQQLNSGVGTITGIGNAGALVNAKVPVVFVTNDVPDVNNPKDTSYYYNTGSNLNKVVSMTGNVFPTLSVANNITADGYLIREALFSIPPFVVNLNNVAERLSRGELPMVVIDASGNPSFQYMQKPQYNPRIFCLFDVNICSYLGNYGAGKTVKTFSLLPGEKTTISLRTYKDSITTTSLASHFLDSKSTHKYNGFQEKLETHMGTDFTIGTNSFTSNETHGAYNTPGILAGLFGSGQSNTVKYSSDNVVTQMNTMGEGLSSAVTDSVRESNKHREIEINTTTETTTSQGEETSIVRMLENTNWSRTLNFVFRQLLQEHHVITWLKNIRFAVTNGDPAGTMVCQIWDLENMLNSVLEPTEVAGVLQDLINYVCHVRDYQGNMQQFFEQHTINSGACVGGGTSTYDVWEKKTGLSQTYNPTNQSKPLSITVPGVILSVQTAVLRTDSVIVDSLLGQGEALDCYNSRLQEAAANAAELENDKTEQAMAIINSIADAKDKADAYRKVFGKCCEDKNMSIGPLSLNVTSTNYDNPQP